MSRRSRTRCGASIVAFLPLVHCLVPRFAPSLLQRQSTSLLQRHSTSTPWTFPQSSTACRQQAHMNAGSPRVIVAGAPASGKGTLCELLKERYAGILHLSTGDMLREAVAEGSAVGLQAQSFIDNGRLVPDELFVDDLTERLQSAEAQRCGWLLDGFPLTCQQADALKDAGVAAPDVLLLVDVPEEELKLRLSGRRVDPITGKTYHLKYAPPESSEVAARLVRRQDDASERAATRLAIFRRHSDAIAAYYGPQLVRLDGSQDREAVFAAASRAIDAAIAARTQQARSRAATATSPATAAMAAAIKALGGTAGAARFAAPPSFASSSLATSSTTNTAAAAAAAMLRGKAAAAAAADALRAAMSLAAFIAADAALARAFRFAAIGFPSSLAGMVALFLAMLLLDGARPDAAASAMAAMMPGATLLSRWMPVFFVPSLVALPLAPPVAGRDAARIALIVVGGYVASLLSTAAMVELLPGRASKGSGKSSGSGEDAKSKGGKTAVEAAVAAAKPRPAPKAFPRRLARSLATLAALAGGAAIAATSVQPLASSFRLPVQQLRTLYLLLATLHGYVLGTRLPPALTRVVHPVVVCALLTLGAAAAFAQVTAAPLKVVLAAYMAKPAAGSGLAGVVAGAGGGALLLSLLGPSILSFALQMFERRRLMWRNLAAVAAVPVAAAVVGLFGTAAAARALALSPPLRLATLPRSITSPLAIAITGMLAPAVGGGASLSSLAVALVVVSGVLGANAGARILDWAGVRDPVARGLAQGASSHGLGTAAMANEPEAFAFSAVSMALTATASTVLVSIPPIRRLLLQVALGVGG